MKRIAALPVLLALWSSGCAHKQLTNRRLAESAATAVVVVGIVLIASQYNCPDCSVAPSEPTARR